MGRKEIKNGDRPNSSIVDSSEITKDRLTLSRQTVHNDSLIVQHDVLPSGEVEHPPSTHHFMALHLTHSIRRVAHIGDRQYEGTMSAGEFCLHPSVYSGFYAWETTDEIVTFIFKQSLGITPYKYVIQQRIERAKQLLKQNKLPLKEVALRCGFYDQSAFSRTFKRFVDLTPKDYRRQL